MRESVISTDPRTCYTNPSFANQGTCFADNYTIKSSFNQRQLYNTKPGSYINDINESIDYILDGFKRFKSYKYKVTANCLYKNRGEEETKTTLRDFRTDEYMTKDHRLDLNNWLDNTRETYEVMSMKMSFME